MPAPPPPMWQAPPFDKKPLGQEPERFNPSMVVVVAVVIGLLVLGAAGHAAYGPWISNQGAGASG